jgi:hypothetical protein
MAASTHMARGGVHDSSWLAMPLGSLPVAGAQLSCCASIGSRHTTARRHDARQRGGLGARPVRIEGMPLSVAAQVAAALDLIVRSDRTPQGRHRVRTVITVELRRDGAGPGDRRAAATLQELGSSAHDCGNVTAATSHSSARSWSVTRKRGLSWDASSSRVPRASAIGAQPRQGRVVRPCRPRDARTSED